MALAGKATKNRRSSNINFIQLDTIAIGTENDPFVLFVMLVVVTVLGKTPEVQVSVESAPKV